MTEQNMAHKKTHNRQRRPMRRLGLRMTRIGRKLRHWFRWMRFLRVLRYLWPLRYLKRLDRYIIKKFIGTYIFSIALIISISIVFDYNDNLSKFTQFHSPHCLSA